MDASSGHVVGVAFQKMVARGVELQARSFLQAYHAIQGHAVPAPVIQRFLEDVASGGAQVDELAWDLRCSAGQCLTPWR